MNGYGVYTWPDGSVYDGDWAGGLRSGKGTFIDINGDRYDGDWSNGQRNGQGAYSFGIGVGNRNAIDSSRYGGDLQNDGKNAKVLYTPGDRYEGNWVNDEMSGQGVYTWANGARYEGEWANGRRTGYGTLYAKDGSILKQGQWKDNKFWGTR